MHDFFNDAKRYYIVTELCQGGDLYDEIVRRGSFDENDAALLMKHILSAVDHCHKNNIVHRDIKPEHILLPKSKDIKHVKLTDFSNSCVYDEARARDTVLSEKVGTPYYIAPEILA